MDPLDMNVNTKTPSAEYSTDFTGNSTKLPPRHIILSASQSVCETIETPNPHHVPKLSCQHCALTFSCKKNLERHVLRRHLPGPVHRCSACNFRHPLASKVRRHWAQSHTPREQAPLDLPCALCSKKFTSRPLLERHVQGAHRPQLCCVLCRAVCLSVAELQAHYSAKHHRGAWLSHQIHLSKNITEQIACLAISSLMTCFYCPIKFEDKEQMKTHILSIHFNIQRFLCNSCGYASRHASFVKSHIRLAHGAGVDTTGYSSLDQCVEMPWNSAALQGSAGLFEEPLPHTSVERLVQHDMRNHLAEAHGVLETSQEKISCTGHFISHSGVKEHFTSEHLSALLCKICKSDVVQRMLETEESLEKALADLMVYESVQEMHKINKIKPNPLYKCLYCIKNFHTKLNMWHHVISYHKLVVRYKCALCERKFYYGYPAIFSHFSTYHPSEATRYTCISRFPENLVYSEFGSPPHPNNEQLVTSQGTIKFISKLIKLKKGPFTSGQKFPDKSRPRVTKKPLILHTNQLGSSKLVASKTSKSNDPLEANLAIKTKPTDSIIVDLPEFVDFTSLSHSDLIAVKQESMEDLELSSQDAVNGNIPTIPANSIINTVIKREDYFDVEIKDEPLNYEEGNSVYLKDEPSRTEAPCPPSLPCKLNPPPLAWLSTPPSSRVVSARPDPRNSLQGPTPKKVRVSLAAPARPLLTQNSPSITQKPLLNANSWQGPPPKKDHISLAEPARPLPTQISPFITHKALLNVPTQPLANPTVVTNTKPLNTPIRSITTPQNQSLVTLKRPIIIQNRLNKIHIQTTITQKPITPNRPLYSCGLCNFKSRETSVVKGHFIKDHIYTVHCYCGNNFKNLFQVELHLVKAHKLKNIYCFLDRFLVHRGCIKAVEITFPRVCCFLCGANSMLISHLEQHMYRDHKNFCKMCGIIFNDTWHIGEHVAKRKPDGCQAIKPRVIDDVNSVCCPYCDVQGDAREVIAHIEQHAVVDCRGCVNSFVVNKTKPALKPEFCELCQASPRDGNISLTRINMVVHS